MTKRTRPTYPHYLADRYAADTVSHEMTVLHDDGLYRHLRCQATENSWNAWFEIITWPGALTYSGDIGGFTFRRDVDMFRFFRGQRVNPDYWGEKVMSGNDALKIYSEDKFREKVWSEVRDEIKEFKGLAKAVHETMSDYWESDVSTEGGARRFLDDFNYTVDGRTFVFADHYEWDLREWNWQFLWTCHAIKDAISRYDVAKAVAVEMETVGAGS
jgi:hypothetical protein